LYWTEDHLIGTNVLAKNLSPLSNLFFIMPHGYDPISFFASFADISVSLDDLLRRIRPVNDRFYFPRRNKLLPLRICIMAINATPLAAAVSS
jgi:hypothetical protein